MIIKQKLHVIESPYSGIHLSDVEMDDVSGYVSLGNVDIEVDFDMPNDLEIRDMKIAGLKAQRTTIEADAQVKVEQINGAIQSLMALEVSA